MTDTQHSTLNTAWIRLGIPEREMLKLPHLKIPHPNSWIWGWSFKCRELGNQHKLRARTQNLWWILSTLHSGFTLHTQDSPIQIHGVLSVECWVPVISLEPGLFIETSTVRIDYLNRCVIRYLKVSWLAAGIFFKTVRIAKRRPLLFGTPNIII